MTNKQLYWMGWLACALCIGATAMNIWVGYAFTASLTAFCAGATFNSTLWFGRRFVWRRGNENSNRHLVRARSSVGVRRDPAAVSRAPAVSQWQSIPTWTVEEFMESIGRGDLWHRVNPVRVEKVMRDDPNSQVAGHVYVWVKQSARLELYMLAAAAGTT